MPWVGVENVSHDVTPSCSDLMCLGAEETATHQPL